MTCEVPSDIWHHVVQFIEEDHLRRLYTLNRAFFHGALNVRYNKVKLSILREAGWLGDASRLCDPYISHRVRHLHINFGHDSEPNGGSLPERRQTSISPPADLINAMRAQSQLVSLVIDCDWDTANALSAQNHVTSLLLPIVRAVWRACSVNLRSLKLCTTQDIMQMILHGTGNVVNLEDLYLHFRQPIQGPFSARYRDVADLLNEKFPNIRQLTVSFPSRMDSSFLFTALGQFSKLNQLSVAAPSRWHHDTGYLPRLSRFIHRNSSISGLHLIREQNTAKGELGGFLHESTLHLMADLLSHRFWDHTNGITELTLPVLTLTPELVDLMAMKYVTVKRLTLVAVYGTDSVHINDFCMAMSQQGRIVANWQLLDMDVVSADGEQILLASLAIAKRFPTIQSIRGQSLSEVRESMIANAR